MPIAIQLAHAGRKASTEKPWLGGKQIAPGQVNGWQTVAYAMALEAEGCSGIHVSSGGLDPRQAIPVGPSYQVPLARAVRQAVAMPVTAVGLITDFEQAEAIVGTGDADLVALARGMLYDPRWPWHAAAHLGGQVKAPAQYMRSQPRQFGDLFETR
jgi:2,4-dienoyl-CoA reductase-like NADH-dependent reductase (Old Yellow Enzyme family)